MTPMSAPVKTTVNKIAHAIVTDTAELALTSRPVLSVKQPSGSRHLTVHSLVGSFSGNLKKKP